MFGYLDDQTGDQFCGRRDRRRPTVAGDQRKVYTCVIRRDRGVVDVDRRWLRNPLGPTGRLVRDYVNGA